MWEKIVLNLLSNAFKFTFDGRIAVRAAASDGERALLEVADTGVGIPAESCRACSSASTASKATRGAHARRLRHRARAGAGAGEAARRHDRRDQHARRGHDVPRAHSARARASAAGPRQRERALGVAPAIGAERVRRRGAALAARRGRRHSCVRADAVDREVRDCDRPFRGDVRRAHRARRRQRRHARLRARLLAPLLRRRGRRRRRAGAGGGAPRRARSHADRRHDAAPRRLRAARALRADAALRGVPVILLSARAGEEARIEGLDAGADDYLVKPFSARELLARVGALLELRRMRQSAEEALRGCARRSSRRCSTRRRFGVYPGRCRLSDPRGESDGARQRSADAGPDRPRFRRDRAPHHWRRRYADELVARFRHTLETGEPSSTPERSAKRLDRGATEYYEWQINRIPLPDGRHGVVCYFRDISAHGARAPANSKRRIGRRTNSSPCSRTSCAIRWRRSAMRARCCHDSRLDDARAERADRRRAAPGRRT